MSKTKNHLTGILYKIANLITYSVISVIIKLSLMHDVDMFQILLLLNVAGMTITSSIAITQKLSPFSYLNFLHQGALLMSLEVYSGYCV